MVAHRFETYQVVFVTSDISWSLAISSHESVKWPVLVTVFLRLAIVTLLVSLDVVLELSLIVVLEVDFDGLVVTVVGEPMQSRVLDTGSHKVTIGALFHQQSHHEASTGLMTLILVSELGKREPRSVAFELVDFLFLLLDFGVVAVFTFVLVNSRLLSDFGLGIVTTVIMLLLLLDLFFKLLLHYGHTTLGSVALLAE